MIPIFIVVAFQNKSSKHNLKKIIFRLKFVLIFSNENIEAKNSIIRITKLMLFCY